ncbi:MAG: site-specific integrase [Alphaproteobacteria bacterium]|nr:site-specific integrase [Alphaproteobacteria bacterium]
MQKLTAKFIENIQSNGKRQEFCDPYLKGFGLRVSKMNTKTFFVRVRYRGKTQRHTIGTYPSYSLSEAREKAAEVIEQAEKGTLHSVDVQKLTIKEAYERFIELYAKVYNKDWAMSDSRLKKFMAEYGGMDLADLHRRDIIAFLDKLVAAGTPTQANRARAALSRFLNWCVERTYIEHSPCQGVPKPAKEKPRDRVLTDDEILKVFNISDEFSYPFGPLFKVLMLTAQRRGEVSGMRWSELDLPNKTWSLPKERAKNGKAHIVPLSPYVVEILESLPRFLYSDFVFTTTGETPVSGHGKYKYRLDEALGVSDWVFHDFRRTAASGMARLEIPPYVVEKVLNHVSRTFSGVHAIYNRYGYDREKREALNKWAEYVIGLDDGNKRQSIQG